MKMVPLVDVEFNLLLPPGVSGADVKVLLGPKAVVVRNKERILTVSAARVETWSTFEIVMEKNVSHYTANSISGISILYKSLGFHSLPADRIW